MLCLTKGTQNVVSAIKFKIMGVFLQKNTLFSVKNTKKGIDKPENECYNNMPHE